MTETSDDHPIERVLNTGEAAVGMLRRFFASYFWLILKNVVGWMLILLAFPVGIALPGPGGLPMFLIGFAMVAFPGKRKLTSHFLRGRPLRIEASIFTSLTTLVSLGVIAILLWIVGEQYQKLIAYFNLDPRESTPGFVLAVAGVCVIAAVVTFVMMRLGLLFVNKLIRIIPKIRRLIRPYLRKWGIVLLPPPPKRTAMIGEGLVVRREGLEILDFSPTSRERFSRWWLYGRPWVHRLASVGITAVLLYFVFEPIIRSWRLVEPHINRINPIHFVFATGMAVAFLVLFRVLPWWLLLAKLGHRLRAGSSARIWITSELVRYVPGKRWQIVSRSYLTRAYGVLPTTCVAAHVLEIVLFLLANAVFAVLALMILGLKRTDDASTRWWLIVGVSVMPLLLTLLHPRVFYSVANRVLVAIGWQRLSAQVSGSTLVVLQVWKVLGVAFASLAMWVIASGPLELSLSQWWLVGGMYAIAWVAGFCAFWAPAGIGVREAVFMVLLLAALPMSTKEAFAFDSLHAFVALLALVLRIWITVAELIVALVAYVIDIDGALRLMRERR
jgi:hypothetical protein